MKQLLNSINKLSLVKKCKSSCHFALNGICNYVNILLKSNYTLIVFFSKTPLYINEIVYIYTELDILST